MEREESSVGISDLIASFLQESLEETDGGVLEVQRTVLRLLQAVLKKTGDQI